MVKYSSDGTFDAPLEKVWKLLQEEHTPQRITSVHKSIQKVKVLEDKGNVRVQESTQLGPDGKPFTQKLRFTYKPPQGFDMEWLSGPLAGSKCTHTYTPQGAKTRVVVAGEFKGAGMDDTMTQKVVDEAMTTAFNEDSAALKKMK